MGSKLNLIGNVFTRLTVIKELNIRNNEGHVMWECKCECGKTVNVSGAYLKKGNTKSCGCLQKEKAANNGRDILTTHGMSKTKIFNIWCGMLKRCNNDKNKQYKNYGGRGIKVCDRWLKFENFYKDMGNKKDNLSIERIDNNGNYEPSNCKWATVKEQSINKRTNKYLTFKNECLTLSQWSEKTGINRKTIYARARIKYTPEYILR